MPTLAVSFPGGNRTLIRSPALADPSWQPGQLLFAGFEGTALPADLRAWVEQGRVGGIILFARNLRDPHQVWRLVTEIRKLAPLEAPLTVAIDQEGGRVQRLRDPWTVWPPMQRLGTVGDLDATAAVARALAAELSALGIGLDFAPVVDVHTRADNPVIGDRSFSSDPTTVGAHARAFIEAMQEAGVAACAKHFPGHGDTDLDSHLALPRVARDLVGMREIELAPFVDAVQAGVASIMTAHVVFEALDRRRPATLSPAVMNLLRDELGFDRLVFSDDLEMKAVRDHFSPETIVREGLVAGVDAFLACKRLDLVAEVLRVLERSPDTRVEHSIERMVRFKREFPPPPLTETLERPPPYPEHRRLADRIG